MVVLIVVKWFGNDRKMDFWSQYCIQENALIVIYKIVIPIIYLVKRKDFRIYILKVILSSEFWARQAQRKVVKIKNLDFSYWAWSTPWGHDLSLKTFCWNPALSWAIRYSVFQPVKFTSSFEFVCGTLFSTFWHLVVKFGYNGWF